MASFGITGIRNIDAARPKSKTNRRVLFNQPSFRAIKPVSPAASILRFASSTA
jgi:hypothetical protein